MNTLYRLILVVVGILAGTKAWAAEIIRVGVVPQFDLRQIDTVWTPILAKLGHATGLQFRLDLVTDIPSFEKALEEGRFDLAYMNPYHFVVAHRLQGYEALVRDRHGKLSGIIVVAAQSPITSIEQLDGKVVAFPSPNAMGAALIPRAEFVRKFHIAIIAHYVKSHSSVYLNVASGLADAGGGIAATLAMQPEETRQRLRVLYETTAFPPHPLAAHPRLDARTRQHIAQAFIALAESADGKALLAEIPMPDPGTASSGDYQSLASLGLDEFYVRP